MSDTWKPLLRRQLGLITAAQALRLGLPSSTLGRRIAGPHATWQKVLPRVYATFPQPLSEQQRVVAGWLYAGDGAVLTGAAALRWLGVPYLPREVTPGLVDLVLPVGRECMPIGFVRVSRTRRPPRATLVGPVRCAPIARACADYARRIDSYDTVLAVVTCVLNASGSSIEALAAELAEGPSRGSRLLRRALMDVARNLRSVPEAELLRLLDGSTLPPPAVNEPIIVAGRRFVPDFRWGWLIVEVDSRLHHLLEPGSWEATQRRHAFLRAAGYEVIPVTPEMIRDDPAGVLSLIVSAYLKYAA